MNQSYMLRNVNQYQSHIFPNPYFDIATTYYPRDIKHTFQWCEYIYFTNGIVASATERIAQYFLTEFKLLSEKTEESDRVLEWLSEHKGCFLQSAIDSIVYGNSFNAIHKPFKRMLKCPNCGFMLNAEKTKYRFASYNFVVDCTCRYAGPFEVVDERQKDPKELNIIRIDPKTMIINHDIFSGKSEYYWEIPALVLNQIFNASTPNRLILNNIPMEILESIKESKKFRINEKRFFHFKNMSLAGVSPQWGFPKYLSIMKLNYYNAILRRANEAISLDFIVPFRTLSPGRGVSVDPMAMQSMEIFVNRMQEMVVRHRYDPADIQICPYPIDYNAFGAEKKALDVTPEIRANLDEILESMNFPAELYRNTLSYQAMPAALRLFENTWEFLVTGLNNMAQWAADHLCNFMGWKKIKVAFTKVTIADDMEKRQILMQLGAAQQVSMMTALKPYGIDFLEEQRNLAYQNKAIQELQYEMSKEMRDEAVMAGSPMGAGGAPAIPMDPTNVLEQATVLAQEMQAMPYEQRRSQLYQIKQQNPTLHAVTIQKMKEMRQRASTVQGQQALAAAGMPGALMPPGAVPPQPMR